MITYAIANFLRGTPIAEFIMGHPWVWPTLESLHFFGMSLLVGTVGLFDLRVLGVAKQIPLLPFHRLVRWGLVGFAINAVSGILFVGAQPLVYLLNPAFQLKVLFIMIAGVNASVFWGLRKRAAAVKPGENAPLYFKVIAATSLCLWIAVMAAGRLLPAFRALEPGPPIL